MPKVRKLVRYSVEALLIFVPIGAITYFLWYPEAFDAFLNWMVGRH